MRDSTDHLFRFLNNLNLFSFLAIVILGCSPNDNKVIVVMPPRTEEWISDSIAVAKITKVCDFDSVVMIDFDTSANKSFEDKSHVHIFSRALKDSVKPFFKDSFTSRYSCCPVNKLASLIVFSSGQECISYSLLDERFDWDSQTMDTSCVFLIPDGYQYRVKIPKKKWRQFMRQLRKNG